MYWNNYFIRTIDFYPLETQFENFLEISVLFG